MPLEVIIEKLEKPLVFTDTLMPFQRLSEAWFYQAATILMDFCH